MSRYLLILTMICAIPSPGRGETLVRLSARVVPEQVDSFKAFGRANLEPLLSAYGLSPTGTEEYRREDSLYVAVFRAASAVVVADARESLEHLQTFQMIRNEMNRTFGTRLPLGSVQARLFTYRSPFVPPKAVIVGELPTVKAGMGRPYIRQFDVTNGLSGPMVTGVVQDPSGKLWVSTRNNGVCVFDGSAWRRVDRSEGLTADRISSLALDSTKRLWITTDQGVFRYDGANWKGFEGHGWTALRNAQMVTADSRGNVWFTSVQGLVRYDGSSLRTFTVDDGLIANRVYFVSESHDGRMVFTSGNGLTIFDPDTDRWERVETFTVLGDPPVVRALIDRDGSLWVSTMKALYRRVDEKWVPYDFDETSVRPPILAIEQDARGTIWIGGPGGVARLETDRFVALGSEEGTLGTAVQIIYPDRDGNLWLGSHGGLNLLDPSFTTFGATDGLPATSTGFGDGRPPGSHLDDDGRSGQPRQRPGEIRWSFVASPDRGTGPPEQ